MYLSIIHGELNAVFGGNLTQKKKIHHQTYLNLNLDPLENSDPPDRTFGVLKEFCNLWNKTFFSLFLND
jgi:hypothetical protein